jgi:hypothetical protein
MISSLVRRVRDVAQDARIYLRDRAERWRVAQEFARLDDRDVGRVLADIGCSRDDLRAVIDNAPRSHRLLETMVARLGLEAQVAATDSNVRREIERRCTTCATQSRCQRWLRRGATDDGYKQFCPNAENFAAMTPAAPNA